MKASPFQRVAITVPPSAWFHGIARAMYGLYRDGLVALGCEICEVPVEPFLFPDASRIPGILKQLRDFRPQAAIGLPKGSFALLCRLPAGRDGWRPNLFTDILEIPAICLWDHAPLDVALALIGPHPAGSAEAGDALGQLKRALDHPLLIHWSPCTYQTALMTQLGLMGPNAVIQELLPALPGFEPSDAPREPGAAFVGRLYQNVPAFEDSRLESIADEIVRQYVADPARPAWEVLSDRVEALPPAERSGLALRHDDAFFWNFAHDVILLRAQTARRLDVLGSAGTPVTCYGNLRTGTQGVPENLKSAEAVPFGPELARLFARNEITIDVNSPGSPHGPSTKPMLTFASGGFALIDRRADFIEGFGEAGAAVCYDNDLPAKLDRFLSDARYRRETGDAIRETIRARYQLNDVLSRVLEQAHQIAGGPAQPKASGIRPSRVLANLLPTLYSRPHWEGVKLQTTSYGVEIEAPPLAWGYCAEIPIEIGEAEWSEPHLRIGVEVLEGRIGIGVLTPAGMYGEQYVSATSGPVMVTLELPLQGPTSVILRNTVDEPSRAVVVEASLCER
jgi:hypothetical protein